MSNGGFKKHFQFINLRMHELIQRHGGKIKSPPKEILVNTSKTRLSIASVLPSKGFGLLKVLGLSYDCLSTEGVWSAMSFVFAF